MIDVPLSNQKMTVCLNQVILTKVSRQNGCDCSPFICSSASCAASGTSYSTNPKPLCRFVNGSQLIVMVLIGPNGKNAWNRAATRFESELDNLRNVETMTNKPTQLDGKQHNPGPTIQQEATQ